VGVSNSELQEVCALHVADLFSTHEGMLYNGLAYALAVDALTHDGPGRPSRLDLKVVCNEPVSPGLDLADVVATEANIPIALVTLLLYFPKRILEPAIKAYAFSLF